MNRRIFLKAVTRNRIMYHKQYENTRVLQVGGMNAIVNSFHNMARTFLKIARIPNFETAILE
jgi:hypothetical protein